MTNTTEVVMTTKDSFEVAYWGITFLILCVTAYAVYFAPLKAVKIGRELNDEQNQLKAKSDLFLTLFSLRGNPTNYTFVECLNKIDVVFQDTPPVMTAWNKLFDSLGQKDLVSPSQTWELLRTNLLSEMAQSLGYSKLQQTDILKNYSPIAHSKDADNHFAHKKAERDFFETATEMNKIWIQHYLNTQENAVDENIKVES
jgi:hypothetical protein